MPHDGVRHVSQAVKPDRNMTLKTLKSLQVWGTN